MFDTAKRCGEDVPLEEMRWRGAWLCCVCVVRGWWTGAVAGECGAVMQSPSYDGPLLDAAAAAEAEELLMDDTPVVSVRICRYCCDDGVDGE